MCSAFLNNFQGSLMVWEDMATNGEKEERSRGKGFLVTWNVDGLYYKLTAMLMYFLRILTAMQKLFQVDQITLLYFTPFRSAPWLNCQLWRHAHILVVTKKRPRSSQLRHLEKSTLMPWNRLHLKRGRRQKMYSHHPFIYCC